MGVKIAFINWNLDQDVYMIQHEGLSIRSMLERYANIEIHLWVEASISELKRSF
jgi:hypothetical protein